MTLRRLGPAVTGFPFAGATRVGDRLVAASRNLVPSRLVVYDLVSRRVTAVVDVPTGGGAWGVASAWDAGVPGQHPPIAYVGQFGAMGARNLYRFDVANGRLEAIAALDAQYLWDIAVDPVDGQVYVVGSPGRVIRWDPATGLAAVVADMDGVLDGVRSVALAGRSLVVGGRHQGGAVLRRLDLGSGTVTQTRPPALAGQTLVYALAATPSWVAAGTQAAGMSGATVSLLAAGDLAVVDQARLDGEAVVDAVAIDASADGPGSQAPAVLATARRSGRVHRLLDGAVTPLGVPVQRSETRGLFLHDDTLVGVSAAEVVWSCDLRADEPVIERVDLLRAGLRRQPQLAMSIAADGDDRDRRIHVGGNFTLTTHHLGTGSAITSHTFVPGEAKDLCVLHGDLYAAVYPAAQVLRRRAGAQELSLLAQLQPDQLRPVALAADPRRGQLLVSTANDRDAGALHAVDLEGPGAGDAVRMALDPFGDGQHPAGMAVDGDVAYVGGSGPRGSLLAWDLEAWRPAWRIDAVRPESGTWVGVAVADGFVVLLGSFGWWVIVELATRTTAVGGRLDADGGQLVVARGGVHAVTSEGLWLLEPRRRTAVPLVRGLASQLWGWPFLDVDDSGALSVIAELDVALVSAAGSDPSGPTSA